MAARRLLPRFPTLVTPPFASQKETTMRRTVKQTGKGGKPKKAARAPDVSRWYGPQRNLFL